MFKQTKQRLYQFIGKVKLSDLPAAWQNPVDSVLLNQEQSVCKGLSQYSTISTDRRHRIRSSSLPRLGKLSQNIVCIEFLEPNLWLTEVLSRTFLTMTRPIRKRWYQFVLKMAKLKLYNGSMSTKTAQCARWTRLYRSHKLCKEHLYSVLSQGSISVFLRFGLLVPWRTESEILSIMCPSKIQWISVALYTFPLHELSRCGNFKLCRA